MNDSTFIFKIINNEQIEIKVHEYSDDIPYCFYDADFFIIKDNHKIFLLKNHSLPSHIEAIKIALYESLQNQRKLPHTFIENIGYLWNLYVNAENHQDLLYANLEYEFLDNYYIWYSTFTTWIYNDDLGDIILEITLSYPHTYSEKFSYKDFLEWMKNYKSLFKTIIPRKTAQQWLAQATQILTTIDENSEQLHAQGKL